MMHFQGAHTHERQGQRSNPWPRQWPITRGGHAIEEEFQKGVSLDVSEGW